MALLVGVVARCFAPIPHGLWEDEIIAAVHSIQPALTVVVDTIRNDVHPPLYFLQLHLWSLASYRDGWLIANSIFWGLTAIASLWWTLRRDGRELALCAAALLAVSPAGLWMSQELRPYAWLSVLLIWAFHFARRTFGPETRHRADSWWLLGLCLAIIYTHAISFLGVIALGIYSLLLLARQRAPRRRFVQAVVIFGVAGLFTVPLLINSLLHDANLGLKATPLEFLSWCSQTVTIDGHGGVAVAGAIFYLGLAIAGLANRNSRLETACFIVLPVVLAILLSFADMMLFKSNIFGTLVAPFAAFVLARLCADLRDPVRTFATAGLLAALAALAFVGGFDRHSVTGYADTARIIRAEAVPGGVVWVPQVSYFKGIAWYLDKPDWGSPLAITTPPSVQWLSVYRKLGPALVARLHLMPTGQSVTAPGGLTIFTGDAYTPGSATRRLWIVTRPRTDLPAGFPPARIGTLQRRGSQAVYALTLTRYE